MMDRTLDDAGLRRLAALDLDLLVVFAALVRERSVTQAAQRLFVGQPAVSASLRRLRAMFGDPLFVKAGRGIVPTDHALALAPQIEALLARVDALTDASPAFEPALADATFRLGLSDDNEIVFLPAIAAALRREAPRARLVTRPVSHTDVRERLDSGDVDVAMSVFGELSPWHCSELLYEQGYGCLFDPQQRKGRRSITLREYLTLPQAIVTFDGTLGGKIDTVLKSQLRERDVRLGTTRFGTLPHLVRGTDLVASLPELVGRVLARDGLAYCPLPFAVPPGQPRMAWHRRQQDDPSRRWLRALLMRCVRDVVVALRARRTGRDS